MKFENKKIKELDNNKEYWFMRLGRAIQTTGKLLKDAFPDDEIERFIADREPYVEPKTGFYESVRQHIRRMK